MNARRLRVAGLALALTLTACSSSAEDAEAQYEIVENDPLATRADKCAAAGRVKDAWLAEGDSDKYEFWSIIEASQCVDIIGG